MKEGDEGGARPPQPGNGPGGTRIAVLAGGIGAAKFIEGLVHVPGCEVSVIVNVGDDSEMHGLYICPDFDIIAYTLAGIVDKERRWGIQGDTFNCLDMLKRYGARDTWFNLGDRDIATHLFRTCLLRQGKDLDEVAREICTRLGTGVDIIPATTDRLRTRIRTRDGDLLDFEDYFVRLRAAPAVGEVVFDGAASAKACPRALDRLRQADFIIIAPSNPFLSIDPIVAIDGIRQAVASRRDETAFVSPVVGGQAIKGPTVKIMRELGLEPSCVGVARHYKQLASMAFLDSVDAARIPEVEALGYRAWTHDTIMSDLQKKKALASFVVSRLRDARI